MFLNDVSNVLNIHLEFFMKIQIIRITGTTSIVQYSSTEDIQKSHISNSLQFFYLTTTDSLTPDKDEHFSILPFNIDI